MNILEQFHAICGEYNMNKMWVDKEDHNQWSADLWRGGRRIASVKRVRDSFTSEFVVDWTTHITFFHEGEREDLAVWADKAGPLGFASSVGFVDYLFNLAQLFIEARHAIRAGKMVAFNTKTIDDHEFPRNFNHSVSAVKVNQAWIHAYGKRCPHMQVVNSILK